VLGIMPSSRTKINGSELTSSTPWKWCRRPWNHDSARVTLNCCCHVCIHICKVLNGDGGTLAGRKDGVEHAHVTCMYMIVLSECVDLKGFYIIISFVIPNMPRMCSVHSNIKSLPAAGSEWPVAALLAEMMRGRDLDGGVGIPGDLLVVSNTDTAAPTSVA